jgi:diacylglycerol O-acyltransferase / wax synthase
MAYDRLSASDAAFLRVETPHEPQHVGSLSILEGDALRDEAGRVRFDEIRSHVERRLHRVPRLRQRIMEVPYGQGRPIWVDDTSFDIDHHVCLTALPRPGDHHQLTILKGRLQAQSLDRSRPLWEMWIIDGMLDDNVGLILKVHHALGDGIANVDLALALLDIEADPGERPEPPRWEPRPTPDRNRLLFDSMRDQAGRPARLARSALDMIRDPAPVMRSASNVIRTATDFSARPEPAPWNVPVSSRRRWVSADVSFDSVRQVRARRSVTVNDVVLAACSGALRSFLIERGEPVDDRVMKAMIPVSLRTSDEHGDTLGNRVSMMIVDLPVDEADPLLRLDRVHSAAAAAKTSGLADGAEAIVRLADSVTPLAAPLTRLVSRRIPMNLVVTNIPGPPVPLYLMGSRLLRTYPYVEVIDNEGLTIAVVSYDDRLFFGLTSDRDVVPDLGLVAAGIEKEFLALVHAVGDEAVEDEAVGEKIGTKVPSQEGI